MAAPTEHRADPTTDDDAPAETLVGVRVRAHPGLCLGYGVCHRFAPNVYFLDADGRLDVHLLDVPPEHALDAWVGASVCPERAITVIGEPERVWRERRTPPATP